jgi:cell wall-associated NlpC family hydrolase
MRYNCMVLLALVIPMGCSTVPPELPKAETAPVGERRAEALLQTLLALGLDYRYGGNSPETGFDCSGLVAHVFREAYGIRRKNARTERARVESSGTLRRDLVFYNTEQALRT